MEMNMLAFVKMVVLVMVRLRMLLVADEVQK